jgi:type 2 lantibiotic biosynthesis protein LanM
VPPGAFADSSQDARLGESAHKALFSPEHVVAQTKSLNQESKLMPALATIQTDWSKQSESYPLPLPERLRGHGLTGCLHSIAPWIDQARERVRRGAHRLAESFAEPAFDPNVIEESLALNLAEPLLVTMTRVMVLELNVARLEGSLIGETPQQRFACFLNRLKQPEVLERLFDEYPVMVDQIIRRLERWSTFSLEFLRHLYEDWSAVRDLLPMGDPGMLSDVRASAGDTHRNGRSVIIASFTSGARIVYKPRSSAVDVHFQQLLHWLNARGARPQFRLLKTLNFREHGWTEFVHAAPCVNREQVAEFYTRQGGYLAILYALQASDFHCENLIASGEHPVLVDLEALFHPNVESSARQGDANEVAFGLEYSALRTGLLPFRLWADEDQPGVDMSGLGSAAGQLSPRGVPRWERADTDEMHVVRERMPMPESENLPMLNDERVNAADFVDSIADGFASVYRTLLGNRHDLLDVLDQFSTDEVRVIARGTHTYGTLLHESFHPDVLRYHKDRLALFDRLKDISAPSPALMKVVEAEQNDLIRGDIPLFTTRPDSRDLWTSDNECIEGYFAEPGLVRVKRHLHQLNTEDLERQLWIVRASVSTLDTHREASTSWLGSARSSSECAITSDQLISAACEIGDRLVTLSFNADNGATWLGLMPAGQMEWSVSPLGLDFYDGLPGVMLFLARLGAVTGNHHYSDLAKSALKSLLHQIEELNNFSLIGAFNGLGGVIYSLVQVGSIWNDQSLYDEAETLLRVLPDLIPKDTRLDVIGGVAGCALALRILDRCKPSAELRKLALACGNRLLETARNMQTGIGWICGDNADSPLTGFAHGNSGIAYALLELSELTGERSFAESARMAFDYERSIFSPVHGNWPDLRTNAPEGFAAAWCHGAPGIGLSRICSRRHQYDPMLRKEIDVALTTTTSRGFGSNHTLCHGDLGNAEILLHAEQTLKEPRWRVHANRAIAAALHNSREAGWICGNPYRIESPGIMTGLAGIGYTLLRFVDPVGIPSILALEPPVLS